jgi:pyruvate dehydrogenase E2 component (dihydrolipoamide acetyltransferase)
MIDIKFPDVGEGITEGTLVKWLVKVGDEIKADQAVAEIETDKAIVEIPTSKGGKVSKLYGKEGDTIKVGNPLVSLSLPGEGVTGAAEVKPEAARPEAKPEVKPEAVKLEVKPEVKIIEAPSRILAAPSTRRLARELGIDISKVTGSGTGGRIIDEDIKKFARVRPAEEVLPHAAMLEKRPDEERIPIKGIRKTIGERMAKSLFTAPHVVSMDEADVSELVSLREKEKKAAQEKGVKLTYLAFIIKAVVVALKQHPYLNASLDPQKNEIVLKHYYNIGIAVDTPEGLMVPVIKNADQKSIMEIARETERLSEEARTRKIKLPDLKGNTFTITNIGSIGGIFSTPIINPPDVAILGVHRIRDMPVIINGEIKPRKILPLVLSFDHRVLDGAQAARFMNNLIGYLKDPDLFLLDVM